MCYHNRSIRKPVYSLHYDLDGRKGEQQKAQNTFLCLLSHMKYAVLLFKHTYRTKCGFVVSCFVYMRIGMMKVSHNPPASHSPSPASLGSNLKKKKPSHSSQLPKIWFSKRKTFTQNYLLDSALLVKWAELCKFQLKEDETCHTMWRLCLLK